MKYRYIDGPAETATIRIQDALYAHNRAVQAELLAATLKGTERTAAAKEAAKLNADAERKIKREKVQRAQVHAAEREYLNAWAEQMERQHAGFSAQLELNAESGEDVDHLHRGISEIEAAYRQVTARLKTLPADPVVAGDGGTVNRQARRALKKTTAKKRPAKKKAAAKKATAKKPSAA